ncbi:methylated-DNA-[protein]-cysteine S-methyltransferase [Roseiarcus fermentans]|uniref:Methylated-DNA-[protein]-cysteine S-methyltransferase n=1 Tax=Roseiarcus fermentans TaxID=1473586 RepID=A0A366FC73_9HYPH|nr:methylated-DNA--[protein]-cysteine S-methyltransferase [Roseiarcus fermentans]RBP12284.1 methylated-DNA-[protein]-cysteine S-methyltransferase [Roseiarcus fermentans]
MDRTDELSAVFETPFGWCAIAWSEVGVTRFALPAPTAIAAERGLKRRSPALGAGAPPPAIAEAVERTRRYFAGEATDFVDVPLDLGDREPFFAQVYQALRRVGWGCTTTYGALAAEVGGPREAARDVGRAMATNPTPLLIPCHRVLAAGGRLGGFSAPGGAETKARMLRLERIDLGPPEPTQRAFAF